MNDKKSFFNFGIPISADVFKLDITSVQLSPKHLLIITVLSGCVIISKGGKSSNYKEGDISLIESGSPVILNTTENDTYVLIVDIDTVYYRELFPHIESAIFDKPNPNVCNKLFPLLLDSAFALIEKKEETYTVINENIKTILKIVLDDCQYFSKIIKESYSSLQTQTEYINLMQSILQYTSNNYTSKASLADFAHGEHLSENYMSHLIKKISGTSFKYLLAFFRCKKAEILLLNPNKRINEIAYLVGFSAPSYFKSSFSKFYKMTPEEYRKSIIVSNCNTNLPSKCTLLDSKIILRDFATKHNVVISITSDRFFTMDTVDVNHYIEHFQKKLSDEGDISNINSEMNESAHEAFINMQKEFRMSTITLDASILMNKAVKSNYLTIAININYLIWSKFKIRFVIYSLSNNMISSIVHFMKFYFTRFSETMDEIDFSIRVNAPAEALALYKLNLSEKLHEKIGPIFNIKIDLEHTKGIKYFSYLYDSFVLAPFAMDELFHPENWKIKIDYSLIDATNPNGYILAGGHGLLTWNGIKKPWWHAYRLAAKLRGSIVSKGVDHIITNNNGIITILTYNTCGLPPTYLQSLTTTQELYNAIQNKGHIREHTFQLMNTFGKYKIITYSVNDTACLFSKWVNLGYPEYLTLEEETVISQVCHPKIEFSTVESSGKIDITTIEKSFGVTCVVLEKI